MRETKPSDDDDRMDGRMGEASMDEHGRAAPSSHYYDYYYSRGGDRSQPATSGGDDRAGRRYYDYYRPTPDMRGDEWRQQGGQNDSWWSQGGGYNYNPHAHAREGGAMAPHPTRPPHRERDFRSMPNEPGGSHSLFPPPESGSFYPPLHRGARPSMPPMPPSAHMPPPPQHEFPPETSDPYYRNYHNYMAYQSSMGGMPPPRQDKEDESSMGAPMHDSRRTSMVRRIALQMTQLTMR